MSNLKEINKQTTQISSNTKSADITRHTIYILLEKPINSSNNRAYIFNKTILNGSIVERLLVRYIINKLGVLLYSRDRNYLVLLSYHPDYTLHQHIISNLAVSDTYTHVESISPPDITNYTVEIEAHITTVNNYLVFETLLSSTDTLNRTSPTLSSNTLITSPPTNTNTNLTGVNLFPTNTSTVQNNNTNSQ
jgi:hypothetical protein